MSTLLFWTDEETNFLSNHADLDIMTIVHKMQAAGYSRTPNAVRKKIKRLGATPKVKPHFTEVEQTWAKILELSKEYKSTAVDKSNGFSTPEKRIISLSDFHFPFQRDDQVKLALAYAVGADAIVLNGDIFDAYGISTFRKTKKIPLINEYKMVLDFVKTLSESFPAIYLTRGNHEHRFNGKFDVANNTTISYPIGDDLLTRIARGDIYNETGELVGCHDFKNVFYQKEMPWWVKIGQTIFAHPSFFSRGPGATAYKAFNWFRTHGIEFDSIVIGHTHQQFAGVYEGTLLMEQGTLSSLLEYQWEDNLRYSSQVNGFAEIWQDSAGNTCFNESRVHYFGTQWPPEKKEIVL